MSNLITDAGANDVVRLTLNRPAVHNAFDDTLIAELCGALSAAASRPGLRALVLDASGRSFSAGADLEWMRRSAAYSVEENERDAAGLAMLMHTLDRFPAPTIAVVQGAAYGGGVGLVACCDIAIASEAAKFCLSEVRLGLIPAVISPYVIGAIGSRQARRYFTTAEMFTAVRARDIGLVHEVVAADALEETLQALLRALLDGAPEAQRAAKDLVFLCSEAGSMPELMAETGSRIAARRASAEGREGLRSFLEKTVPAWRSK